MAQMCSPCSIPLCGNTVTKTRLELNAEVMAIIIIIITITTTTTTTIIIIIINIIKSSRATSRVKWLKHEETNVSRSIAVLVLRVLKWLKLPTVSW
jgi:hypothetical protein